MIEKLLPKLMRYQTALLPDAGKTLGFRPFWRKLQCAFVAFGGRTWPEQTSKVPE